MKMTLQEAKDKTAQKILNYQDGGLHFSNWADFENEYQKILNYGNHMALILADEKRKKAIKEATDLFIYENKKAGSLTLQQAKDKIAAEELKSERVYFEDWEDFENDMISCIKTGPAPEYLAKYRTALEAAAELYASNVTQ